MLAHFFSQPWQQPATGLSEDDQAVVLNIAGFDLRALGRLAEAVQPMQAGLAMQVKQEDWQNAAIATGNLSELTLTLGDLPEALHYGAQAVDYADRSGDLFHRMSERTTHADALLQSGDLDVALALLQQAEQIQQQWQPEYPRLYSLWGFRYCDWVLAQGEAAQVLERAEQTLAWAKRGNLGLLTIALDQLSLAKAHCLLAYPASARPPQTIASLNATDAQAGSLNSGAATNVKFEQAPSTGKPGHAELAQSFIEQAVAGLRAAGQNQYLPLALLARAALSRLQQNFTPAHKDLAEVLDIAEPANMHLHRCDYHLEAARLAQAERDAKTAADHCDQAEQLIKATGYLRRLPELQTLQTMVGAIPCGCPDGVQP